MSDTRRERWTLITASLVILATVALGFVLWYTRAVMIPFVLAVFVVAVVAPIADWLEVKAHFRRWMSVPLVMALVVVGAVAVLLLLTYVTSEVGNSIERYQKNVFVIADRLTAANAEPAEGADNTLQKDANSDPDEESSFFDFGWLKRLFNFQWVKPIVQEFISRAKEDWKLYVPTTVGWLVGQARSIISIFFLMLIFVFFLLVAREPGRMELGGYAEIENKIRRYLSIKTGMSTLTGALVGAILSILGVPLALVFGVLTFLLNFIPSVGSIIATFLPLPIACAAFVFEPMEAGEPARWWMLIAAIALPGSVQIFIGNVIEPRVMGEGLELHPIVILIALVFWGLLWGPIGAIMAVPLTAVIRIATSRFVSLKLVSDTMIGRLPPG